MGVFWWKYGIWGCKYAVWCDIWQVWGVSTDPNRLTLSDAGQLVLLPTRTFARSVTFKSDKSSRNKSYEIVVLISDGSDSANMKSLLVKVQNDNPSQ